MKKTKTKQRKVPKTTRFYYLVMCVFGVILANAIGIPMLLLVLFLAGILKLLRWLEIY